MAQPWIPDAPVIEIIVRYLWDDGGKIHTKDQCVIARHDSEYMKVSVPS